MNFAIRSGRHSIKGAALLTRSRRSWLPVLDALVEGLLYAALSMTGLCLLISLT